MHRIAELLLDTYTLKPGLLDICLRLLCAMLVGLVIGAEREYTNRPAGMRTHILVGLGSCAVMLTGQLIFAQYRALGAMPDPARLAAQVITGVGFLGAGTILRDGATVRGLTTAASLWSVACLGIAAGAGYYFVALVGMIFIFITLTLFEVLQNRFIPSNNQRSRYVVKMADLPDGLNAINALASQLRVNITDMLAEKADGSCTLTFNAETFGRGSIKRRLSFFEKLVSLPEIESVKECSK